MLRFSALEIKKKRPTATACRNSYLLAELTDQFGHKVAHLEMRPHILFGDIAVAPPTQKTSAGTTLRTTDDR